MQGNINPNIRQQAKGINQNPTKNPNPQQANIQHPTNNLTLILSLQVGPTASNQNITHIMNDQNHCARQHLVAHEGEQDEGDGDEVVQ